MAKRILNKSNCRFMCPALQGTITAAQLRPTFHDGNGTALTQQTTLTGNGICSILTAAAQGAPTPCTLKMMSSWISGLELQKKINGIPLLNEDAKMMCPVGSVITVQKPLMPIVSLNIDMPPLNNGVGKDDNSSDKNSSKSGSTSDESTSQTEKSPVSDEKDTNTQDKNMDSPEKEDISEPQEDEQPEKEESPQKCLCSYGSCDKPEECPYMQAKSTIDTKGAAKKLRTNSKTKEIEYDEYSQKMMDKYHVSWNNQAHHLISVNAAYCEYSELVKLGNYFGYDINCEENCYFLPCWEKGDGYGDKTSHYKKAQAYEVMKASGMQWHVGQHEYPVSIPDAVKEKYPELKTMECYNQKVNKDLKEFLSACDERFKGKCLEKNYEEHRRWFIERMNMLSRKIETHLDLFRGNPKDSYPYFVSAEALRYAYEVPRSGKVILIYPTKTQWVVKRYHYTNYLQDDTVQLNLLSTQVLAFAENRRDETIRKLILFCENVSCFLIVGEKEKFKLPFSYQVRYQYIDNEESERVESHFSAMLAEQVDDEQDGYISPKAMAAKRLKECGLL